MTDTIVNIDLDEKTPGLGHNSGAADRLRSGIERIERLQEERKALNSDVKDIFSELKSAGFNIKAVREIIKLRAADPDDVEEQENDVDVYKVALGMVK
jgi:uncharacterized protein (UPF0335 family)